jgi:F-type H+-transporting ATPase subunit gamma
MASAREIRRRIKSVTNIRQITMALEAVSASKVRRATAQALAARAYANLAMQVLVNVALSNKSSTPLHPLLTLRENVGNIAILMITSDRGSAGAYNANVIRVARQFAQHLGRPTRWIAVGRKGRDILFRAKENIVAEFTGLPPWWTIEDVRPIARTAIDEFLNGYADEVYVAYTDFINTLTQSPRIQRLLPLTSDEADKMMAVDYVKVRERPTAMASDYIFEPGAGEILDSVVPRFVETIIYELILESNASEHSARMVAMRNASENAKALADDLQLSYNKARQAAITGEILDIVGGVEALKGR